MLEKIWQRAQHVLVDYVDVPGGIVAPQECTFFDYYEEVKLEARRFIFPLEGRIVSKERSSELRGLAKLDLVQMAAQRLVYRYFASMGKLHSV